MLERELPALWSLLGHADGLNATLAHAAESCVANAQGVCENMAHATPRHHHAELASQLGLGDHAYVLPLMYSLLAGLSTGIAAAAMITVSVVDLFLHIAEEIGIQHTLCMSVAGALTVILAKQVGTALFTPSATAAGKGEKMHELEDSERQQSELRLLRVGLLSAMTLTAHNLPEGMAVAISTMGSAKLGLKLSVAIALHNIPEGLAIACPLLMSKRYSPWQATGVALVSGLSEPLGALLTLLVLQNIITQERIDYALAFVGGVMMAVALLELLPEAQRLKRADMVASGSLFGFVIMSTSLYFLG